MKAKGIKRSQAIERLRSEHGDDVMDVYTAGCDAAEWWAGQTANEFVLRRFVQLTSDQVPAELPEACEKTLEKACSGRDDAYRTAYRIGFADGAAFFAVEYYGPPEETLAHELEKKRRGDPDGD